MVHSFVYSLTRTLLNGSVSNTKCISIEWDVCLTNCALTERKRSRLTWENYKNIICLEWLRQNTVTLLRIIGCRIPNKSETSYSCRTALTKLRWKRLYTWTTLKLQLLKLHTFSSFFFLSKPLLKSGWTSPYDSSHPNEKKKSCGKRSHFLLKSSTKWPSCFPGLRIFKSR
jgi:hypothetical protein